MEITFPFGNFLIEKVSLLFTLKDETPVFLRSGIVYIYLSTVAALLPTMEKLTSILKSQNVTLMESLLINRDHPPLNKSWQSLLLEIFDDRGT